MTEVNALTPAQIKTARRLLGKQSIVLPKFHVAASQASLDITPQLVEALANKTTRTMAIKGAISTACLWFSTKGMAAIKTALTDWNHAPHLSPAKTLTFLEALSNGVGKHFEGVFHANQISRLFARGGVVGASLFTSVVIAAKGFGLYNAYKGAKALQDTIVLRCGEPILKLLKLQK